MKSFTDQFIHEISVETIITILKDSAWKANNQSITSARLAHINALKFALNNDGKAYFKIWPGEAPLKGSCLPHFTNSYFQANAYAMRFLREIEVVFGIGNAVIDNHIPNLIIATKVTSEPTKADDILRIQQQSNEESLVFNQIKATSYRFLISKINIYKTLTTHLTFFKSIENQHLEQNRQANSTLQHEYDKRFGLVPV